MRELPSLWEYAPLAAITLDVAQRVPNPSERFVYIDIGSIDRSTKKIVSPQELLGKDAPSRARKLVKAGDTLVSMTRPNLNAVALVPNALDDQIASTGFDVLRPSGVEPRWLYYLVRTQAFIDAMSSLVQGALYPAVRHKDVRSYIVPVAPREEQTLIVNKLDSVLARVEACRVRLNRVPSILKRFRQSVLAAATSGKLTEDWREDRGDRRDTSWQQTDVQMVAQIGTGSTPLRSNPDFFSDAGTPWITSAATSQAIVRRADEFVTQSAIASHRLKVYPIGTLLVAMYGEGKTRGQVTELGINATINQACAAIVVNEKKALKDYIKLALQANYFEMRELAEGGNQPNLNLSKIKEFPLLLPSLEEQVEIVRRAESLFALVESLELRHSAACAKVDKLTPNLLTKAFCGELVSQDPNNEPAAKLLERAAREALTSAPSSHAPKRRSSTPRTGVLNKVVADEADASMKSRMNVKLSDITHDLLSELFEGRDQIDAKVLWTKSGLSIDDFYVQLDREIGAGLLRVTSSDDSKIERLATDMTKE